MFVSGDNEERDNRPADWGAPWGEYDDLCCFLLSTGATARRSCMNYFTLIRLGLREAGFCSSTCPPRSSGVSCNRISWWVLKWRFQ